MMGNESVAHLVQPYLEGEVEEEVLDVDTIAQHGAEQDGRDVLDDGFLREVLVAVAAERGKDKVDFRPDVERHPVEVLLPRVVAVKERNAYAGEIGADDSPVC